MLDIWRSTPPKMRRLRIYLIKPSKYDDDGYVIRYLRGVLPSNTLSCLYGLTDDLARSHALGEGIAIESVLMDEAVQKIDVKKIVRRAHRARSTLTLIALVGVQSNQFPRASDLALQFRDAGLPVMIGGFHVSGLMSLVEKIPDDIQALMDRGVSIVKGEVEETWGDLLRDLLRGQLRPLYDFIDDKPDLYNKPIPRVNREYMRRFVYSGFGTIDAGRGCPFDCSFCTIINVQGRKMRHRSAEMIEARIREDYAKLGVGFYFFTDDNFSRNKNWEPILDRLIHLRRSEGINVQFMMQVDVLSYKIPGFVEKAKAAGCSNVFIGMESINPRNLAAAGKTQNDVEDFKNLIAAWHNAGIMTHVGYILGFPFDTAESIREDIRRLKEEIKVDIASFFILTPLPGSADHAKMVRDGAQMDSDYNRYDSFHETMHYENFKPGELQQAYREAWESFYSTENMKAVLARSNRYTYWDIFKNYLWYRHSLIDGQHPMIAGFFRKKDRTTRRAGFPVENRFAFARRRAREIWTVFSSVVRLLLEMEEVWLQTHARSREKIEYVQELQHRVASLIIGIKGLDRRDVLRRLMDALHQFHGPDPSEFRQHLDTLIRRLREFDPKQGLQTVIDQIREIQQRIDTRSTFAGDPAAGPREDGTSRLGRLVDRITAMAVRRASSRMPIQTYWEQTMRQLRSGRLFRVNPLRVGLNMMCEARLLAAFICGITLAKIRYNGMDAPLEG